MIGLTFRGIGRPASGSCYNYWLCRNKLEWVILSVYGKNILAAALIGRLSGWEPTLVWFARAAAIVFCFLAASLIKV